MTPRRLLPICALLACAGGAAWADPAPVSFGAPVQTAQLSQLRGGTDTTVNDARLHGTTADNNAINVQTGMNTITDGAFGNMSGIPVVIQNSGANVLIQNSLILNLHLQ